MAPGAATAAAMARVKARAYVKQGNFDHGVTVNYASGYSNNSISSPTYCATQKVADEYLSACGRVGSNTTFDYNLSYTGIPHVKLSLSKHLCRATNYPCGRDASAALSMTVLFHFTILL